jgi:hypothetical protein
MCASPRRIALAAMLMLLAASSAHAAATAKAAIKEATAAAQKWQADAVLTHVSTLRGGGDGKAVDWLYTFYSPKAKKSAIVTTKDKAVTDVAADVRNTSTDPLGTEFVDSDQAAEAAAKAGLKIGTGAKDAGFALYVGNQAVGKPQLFWAATVMSGDAMSSILLDGRSAALIRRDEQKFK